MAHQVSCPGCRTAIKLQDATPGTQRKVRCPMCTQHFMAVIGGAAGARTQAGRPPAAPPPTPPKPEVTRAKSKPKKNPPAEANDEDSRPVIRRPAGRSQPKKGSAVALILVGVFLLFGLGAVGAAVGGYFLYARHKQAAIQAAQNAQQPPDLEEALKQLDKNGKLPLIPDNKPPIEKRPTERPKEKPPAERPNEKPTPEDLPPPKTEPPAVTGLYKLKDQPTPAEEVKLEEGSELLLLTSDGKTAVVGKGGFGNERRVLVVELPSGKTLHNIPMPGLHLSSLALTPDGKTVLVGGGDDRFNVEPKDRVHLHTISLETGKVTGSIAWPKHPVVGMAVSRDGGTLACAESSFGGVRGVVHVLDLKKGTSLFYREKVHTNLIKGIALTPDKKYVISTGVDNNGKCKIVVFDIAADKEKYVLTAFAGTAEGMALSSDGKWLAAAINAGNGGSLRVWEVETGAEKMALIARSGGRGARRVAFGPEDKTVIATFYDNSTRAFDVLTGNEEGGFRGHTLTPNALAISGDGKTVVTANFKDLKIWQFPDSLKKLGKPDDPPWVEIVREGKAVESKTPAGKPKDDPSVRHIRSATVEHLSGGTVHLTVDGKPASVQLRDDSRFFAADGKAVTGDAAKKVHRIGNVVQIKSRAVAQDPVLEMRLLKEGPAEATVEKAKLKGTTYPIGVTFQTPEKGSLAVKFARTVRYVDHEGKEMADREAGRFFNEEDTYAVKLRMEAGEEVPILVEARLTPGKGELPVFLKYPLGQIGAKRVKNAVVKTVTLEVQGRKLTRPQLVAEGEDPVTFLTNQTETRAYDMKGEPAPVGQVLQPGMRVDAVVIPRAKMHLVLEARALVPIIKSEPPPKPKKIVEHKDVEVIKLKGNSRQTFLKINNRNVQVKLDANLKAKDKEGKEAAAQDVLKNGNRVDVKAEDLRPAQPHLILLEVRLVSLLATSATYQSAEVVKKVNNSLYAVKHDGKEHKFTWSRETKAFDAEGKAAKLDEVMQEGKSVDIVVESGRKTPFPRLLEVRPAKGK